MTVFEAIKKRRSIRKFEQQPISEDILLRLTDCGRYAASAANMQPLKYGIINEKEKNEMIFSCLKWAGYLKDYYMAPDERPTAYIVVFGDKNIKASAFEADAGAAVTNILLEAEELGIASCWLGAVDRNRAKELFKFDDNLELLYVVALGYPAQKSMTVDYNGDIKYYLNNDGTVCVPKRAVEQITFKL